MEQHFDAAPWPLGLKLTSAFATILLGVVGLAALRVVPWPPGFTQDFGFAVAAIPPAALGIAYATMVTGYTLSPGELGIRRPFWTTTIRLDTLRAVAIDPSVCKGSIRLFGNAGLFAFTGLYWNKRLGRYRLFATNFRYAVVLKLADRTIVISPASVQAFVDTIRNLYPNVQNLQI